MKWTDGINKSVIEFILKGIDESLTIRKIDSYTEGIKNKKQYLRVWYDGGKQNWYITLNQEEYNMYSRQYKLNKILK